MVAATRGVDIRCDAGAPEILVERGRAAGVRLPDGEQRRADAVSVNAEASAVGAGLFGPAVSGAVEPVGPAERSLSAIAVTAVASPRGFPLVRHTVFFSRDYRAEFDAIFRERRLPDEPTVYICAQDRGDVAPEPPPDRERLLILVNAPAVADIHAFSEAEIATCLEHMRRKLDQCGLELTLEPESTQVASPSTFERLFPATGGAIYGRASHGWRASFQRPDATTNVPGLY
ncbi:hypothetical protein WDZ92_47755, partial [Nostoc sp. NIES-2111]